MVNAPVNIDGGDGLDTVTVIGTEFSDDFVVTESGIYGAGLSVRFVGVEVLRVDGAEGDDRFFVQSTNENVLTVISGGLGNDTFNVAGDTPPVISNDLLGHSGIVTHSVESVDPAYQGIPIDGISANVVDNDEPAVAIRVSDGGSRVIEHDGTVGVDFDALAAAGLLMDSYTVVLTRAPTGRRAHHRGLPHARRARRAGRDRPGAPDPVPAARARGGRAGDRAGGRDAHVRRDELGHPADRALHGRRRRPGGGAALRDDPPQGGGRGDDHRHP